MTAQPTARPPNTPTTTAASDTVDPIITITDSIPTPSPNENFKPAEEPSTYIEKSFITPKPLSHSPKISPSSIPNPSPSVTTTKQVEPGYPSYGGYLYSIPGYSAFQPVAYQGMLQQNQNSIHSTETQSSDFMPFPITTPKEIAVEETSKNEIPTPAEINPIDIDTAKPQTDFEDNFATEIVPAVPISDVNKTANESTKMCITSMAQGSGATITIPSQIINRDVKKKPPERFSLKTSIPISKIDLKCVNNHTDSNSFQSSTSNKVQTTFNTNFQKAETAHRVEIQSNIVIKGAVNDTETTDKANITQTNNSIKTLINAAETLSRNDNNQFWKTDIKPEVVNEIKDPPPPCQPSVPTQPPKALFNPMNIETKINLPNKTPDNTFAEQKNQILFIQNKNTTNSKMLLTIQQQNPQVLLQRNNFDSKNMQAPSRLSNKKSKDELLNDNTSSKVVALKRMHQENCDENDFENLITENQIYGNKIVVKEKSQGTHQEQDLKNKIKTTDTPTQPEAKNVVLQPNFVYLSNVQFPANLMMIKNNTKVTQTVNDGSKTNKNLNDNKFVTDVNITTSNIDTNITKSIKTQHIAVNKEMHVLKSSNNVLQTLTNNNTKTDLVFQTSNQKVIMNPQIVYQVPMIVESDNKMNQPFINREFPKFLGQNKKDFPNHINQTKQTDKLFIACPYQMDSKLQPKIVITNIRPKIAKIDEISSLDIYEKKKRLRRLKYLTNRDMKDNLKLDIKKSQDKVDSFKNIITPERIKTEIFKEFTKSKVVIQEESSDSDSDYGEDELKEYDSIIEEFGGNKKKDDGKAEFLANFRLATKSALKEKELERQERAIRKDSVAAAYIAAGRIDRLTFDNHNVQEPRRTEPKPVAVQKCEVHESTYNMRRKQMFLSQLKLMSISLQVKEGQEIIWQEILKERKRRNGKIDPEQPKKPKVSIDNLDLDPNSQLRMLTEIKKSVNENNNLIKRRLDLITDSKNEGDSIHVLAEKNISELNRLSKMADRCVKLISGQETPKRDLNPGFDSENIQKPSCVTRSFQNYPNINIPDIAKIISLKTAPDPVVVASTQATSMDEPQNTAAGVKEMFCETMPSGSLKDFSCQVQEILPWPGIDAIMKSYKEFDAARKREMWELQRRSTSLKVESAQASRGAACAADCARALLAERRALAAEEGAVRANIHKLWTAINVIKNY